MPPQPARSISSYFSKTPAKVVSSAAATSAIKVKRESSPPTTSTSNGPSSSSRPVPSPSSPLTDLASSPSASTSTGRKRTGFLSDAAKQAILDASEDKGTGDGLVESERASKKMKLESSNGTTKTADIFAKAANPKAYKPLQVVRADSRESLRKSFADHPHTMELLQMELDTLGEDWLIALQEELTKPYFLSLKEFVTSEQAKKKVFPPAQEVYSWSKLCPLKDVRVVIIGQDPYHDDGQANGLAFSVRKGMRIPPSLRNIYKEMADDLPGFVIPKHGDLTEWAKHGVLLLNTSLTVPAHDAGKHSGKGWEQFTAAVLRVVTTRLSPTGGEHLAGANGVCFMAWGAHAQKMCAGVDTKKHLILKSVHPSPLSAMRGFFGSKHFSKANAWLEERYGPGGGIDWASLGGTADAN